MPALSSTMTEGKIVQWLKGVGDKVEAGDAIMVVESDKADMDVEAFEEGYIAQVRGSAGRAGCARACVRVRRQGEGERERVSERERERGGRGARTTDALVAWAASTPLCPPALAPPPHDACAAPPSTQLTKLHPPPHPS